MTLSPKSSIGKFSALFVMLFAVGFLYGQPFTLKQHIKPTKLEFHPFNPKGQPLGKGKINITEVNQVKDTLYFYTNAMSVFSPTYVSIDSEVPENKIWTGIYK